MTFEIAGLNMNVWRLPGHVGMAENLQPFAVGDMKGGDASICDIECGVAVPVAEGLPVLTNAFDGKTLSLWLEPGRCVLSLRFDGDDKAHWMCASRDWRVVKTDCTVDTESGRKALEDFIMISFIYSSASCGTVLIHASSVAVGAEGVVFTGPSGIGKSTHSRLWLRHVEGSRLLNDDQPALRVMPGGEVFVCGTPWSGKTSCYRNERARLKAVFRMRQAGCNRAVRLGGVEAFCALIDNTSLIRSDRDSFAQISGTLADIAGKVPVYDFHNRPEAEAAAMSYGLFSSV